MLPITLRGFSQRLLVSLRPVNSAVRYAASKPVMNRLIQQDPLRVTYDGEDGEKKSEIMPRKDALELAKNRKMDLILSACAMFCNNSIDKRW